MSADDRMDAILAGLDQSESITTPALPEIADLNEYEATRHRLLPDLLHEPAARRKG